MTAQVGDKLIFGKDTEPIEMHCEISIRSESVLPPSIVELTDEEVFQNYHKSGEYYFSTGCWRGYIATWQLKDEKLYLASIAGCYRLDSTTPVFADWVNDALVITRGPQIKHVHEGYETQYQYHDYIYIRNGFVVGRETIEHPSPLESPYLYGWQEQYLDWYQSCMKEGKVDLVVDDPCPNCIEPTLVCRCPVNPSGMQFMCLHCGYFFR
jgi:hypothetical protein